MPVDERASVIHNDGASTKTTMSYPTYRLPAATVQEDFALVPSALQQEFYACVVGPNRKVAKEGLSAASDLAYGAYNTVSGNTLSLIGLPGGSGADVGSVKVTLTDVAARVATIEFSSGPSSGFVVGAASALNKVYLQYATLDINNPLVAQGFAESTVGADTYERLTGLGLRDVRAGDTVIITTEDDVEHQSVVLGLEPLYSDRLGDLGGGTGGNDSNNPAAVPAATIVPTAVRVTGTWTNATQSVGMTADYRNGIITDTYLLEVTSAGAVGSSTIEFAYTSLEGDDGTATSDVAGLLAVGTRDLVIDLTYGSLEVGDQIRIVANAIWAQSTLAIESAPNNWTWNRDISYEIRVIRGGDLATDTCRVAISAVGGTDRGSQADVTNDTYFSVGSYGLRAKFSAGDKLRAGDIFLADALAKAAGPMGVLRLRTPLPVSQASHQITEIKVLSNVGDLVIPEYGYPTPELTCWELATDGEHVTINNSLEILDPTYLDVYGDESAVPVYSAGIKIEYTSVILTGANALGSITSLSSIDSILGPSVPENELSFGVLKAFENSNGQAVYYVPTTGTELAQWEDALKALEMTDSVFYIIPTTLDLSVLDLYKAHVLEMSSTNVGFERALIGCRDASFVDSVVAADGDGNATTGYIASDGEGGYTLAHMPGQNLTEIARAGDTVRTSYSTDAGGNDTYESYVIGEVTSDETLSLVTGPDGLVGDSDHLRRMEIWRDLTAEEAATKFADQSNHFAHRRVTNIWPDNAELDDGTSVEGWAMAAAYGGLCSSVVPHQPVTNVQIAGFNKVPDVFRFNRAQLDKIAAGGTCIIVQDTKDGAMYVRHQLTTDRTDVNTEEFSITRNADSIAKFMRSFLRPFVGQYNIHEDFLSMMETLTRQRFDYLEKTTANLKAGPQIIDYGPEVTVAQDPLIRTRVTIKVPVHLPYPANNLDMTIVIL